MTRKVSQTSPSGRVDQSKVLPAVRRQARPRDGAERGPWWTVYQDAQAGVNLKKTNQKTTKPTARTPVGLRN